MVLVLGIVKASLEILGIGIGVKKVVLLMSGAKLPWGCMVYSFAISLFYSTFLCKLIYTQQNLQQGSKASS